MVNATFFLRSSVIDIEAMIATAQELAASGSGEGGCLTVAECLERPGNEDRWADYFERCGVQEPPPFCNTLDLCYTEELLPGAVGCGQ